MKTKSIKLKKRYAILIAQGLSYLLIIAFLFANETYDFIDSLFTPERILDVSAAYYPACLIALVGATSLWLTWYYSAKSSSIRDMLVICAWTHRVKSNGRWISLEEFFTDQLGYAVSHGLSEAKLVEIKEEIDTQWRTIDIDGSKTERTSRDDSPPSDPDRQN